MTIPKITTSAVLGLLVASLALTGLFVHAQTANSGLIVSPAIMELNADRGGTYEFTMSLENAASQEVYTLFPYAQKFTTNDDAGTPVLAKIDPTDPVFGWVEFNEESYALKPGDETSARFRVTIPESAEPGSYYLAISYTTNNDPESESTVVIDQEVSALLFITVKGAITREVNFDEFTSNITVVDPFLDDLLLTSKINTEGNVYYKPTGNIFVGQDSESPDQNLPINPNQKIILPGTKRTFHQVTQSRVSIPFLSSQVDINTLTDGDVVTNELVKPIIKNERFQATIVYANSDGTLEQKTVERNIFFFPWKTTLIAIVLAVVSFGLYKWSRSYTTSRKEQSSQTKKTSKKKKTK
jgi:hypothetical protein